MLTGNWQSWRGNWWPAPKVLQHNWSKKLVVSSVMWMYQVIMWMWGLIGIVCFVLSSRYSTNHERNHVCNVLFYARVSLKLSVWLLRCSKNYLWYSKGKRIYCSRSFHNSTVNCYSSNVASLSLAATEQHGQHGSCFSWGSEYARVHLSAYGLLPVGQLCAFAFCILEQLIRLIWYIIS